MNDDELILRRKKQNADRVRAHRKRKRDLGAMPSTSTVQSGEPVTENVVTEKVLHQKLLNAERCRRYRQKCKRLKCKRLNSGVNIDRGTSDSDTSTSRDTSISRESIVSPNEFQYSSNHGKYPPRDMVQRSMRFLLDTLKELNLPNDVEKCMEYHLLGSVSQIRIKPGCVPTKLQSPNKEKKTSINTEGPYVGKKRKKAINEECDKKSNSAKYLEFEVPTASAVPHGDLENIKENDHNITVDKSIQSVGVPCLATSSGAETSSVTQRMLSNDSDHTASGSSDHIAGKATTCQEHDYVNNPSPVALFIKEEVCDPDYDQPMDQDNNTAAGNYKLSESNIKKEPVEDTCQFEMGVSHVPKSSAETEELKRQLEAKTSEVEMYKNEVNELQQKNCVFQDRCEKLTKLLKKCLTKSPCSEIGTEFTEILSHSPHKVEHNRTQMQLKERQFKAKIKLLLERVEESQQLLQAKQKQWDIKENEFIEKIKQLEHNLQELQQGQVGKQAVQFIEKDKILEEKEREWLEKERKWLEQLEMKETQWLEKERLWQEQVEERDKQISQLQGKCIEPLGTNR